MPSNTPEYLALKTAITERLNAHDPLGVMDHGAGYTSPARGPRCPAG